MSKDDSEKLPFIEQVKSTAPFMLYREECEKLREQLAAEQLNSAKLRGLLEHIMRCIPYGGFAQIHHGSATYADIDSALALPHDDTALREWGARLLEKAEASEDHLWYLASQLRSGDWTP